MIFNKGNIKIDIEKLPDESDTIFNQRAKLMLKIKTKSKDKYSDFEIEKFSKIWANIKYKNCKYNSSIYRLIKSFTKDLDNPIEEYNLTENDSDDDE